ncbi:hypothetical protein GCM10027265_01100 [Jatrophihabitans fulvus]
MRRAVIAYSTFNRRRKARQITGFMLDHAVGDVIFVGCSPGANPNEGIVERAVAERSTVLAACDVLECTVPWPFVRADGRALPFPDKSADMVLANAVIEHVGDRADQERFVGEQCRVARSWVITTPNRWFPVESHTSTAFAHWSARWRARRPEFTRLMSRREFTALLPDDAVVVGRPWSATFTAYWVDAAAKPTP